MSKLKHAAGLLAALAATPGWAHDYPTADLYQFVQECIYRHADRPDYEMVYKCSCVIDAIAKEMKYDDYVDGSTIARNAGLAGERGGVFRDPDSVKKEGKHYKEVVDKANKECLMTPPTR